MNIQIEIEVDSINELDHLRRYIVGLCTNDNAAIEQLISKLQDATNKLKTAEDTAATADTK